LACSFALSHSNSIAGLSTECTDNQYLAQALLGLVEAGDGRGSNGGDQLARAGRGVPGGDGVRLDAVT